MKGSVVGQPLAGALEKAFPNDIWIQGVGGPYGAELATNFLPKGTNQESIDEAKRLFNMANSKCPDSIVVTAGYRFVPISPSLVVFHKDNGLTRALHPITARERPSSVMP